MGAIAAACLIATALIVLIALHTTPIADDYGDLASIGHSGVLTYLHGYWVGLTDRYANAVFMVLLIKAFGTAAIHVATPLLSRCARLLRERRARRRATAPQPQGGDRGRRSGDDHRRNRDPQHLRHARLVQRRCDLSDRDRAAGAFIAWMARIAVRTSRPA